MSHPHQPQDPNQYGPQGPHGNPGPGYGTTGPQYPPHPSGQDQYARPWPGDGRGEEPPRTYGGFTRVEPPKPPAKPWQKWVLGGAVGLVFLALVGSCGGEDPEPAPAPAATQAAEPTPAPVEEPVEEAVAPAQSAAEIREEAFLSQVRDLDAFTGMGEAQMVQSGRGMCQKLEAGVLTPVSLANVILEVPSYEQEDMTIMVGSAINAFCPDQMDKIRAAEAALAN